LNAGFNPSRSRVACPRSGLARASCLVLLGALASSGLSDLARGADLDGDAAKAAPAWPTTYLDLRTIYSRVPAGSLSIGFSNPSAVSSAIATLQMLSTLPNAPNLPGLSSSASQGIGIDVPLTVDLNDRVSVYGGFSASTSQSGLSDWSTLAISSWNVGVQVDV
jgi:hypothetical protein